jgi:hypothetical protein
MIADPIIEGAALGAIVESLARAGRYAEALERAEGGCAEEWVYMRIAAAQAAGGRFEAALRLARTMVEPAHRIEVIDRVLVRAYPPAH